MFLSVDGLWRDVPVADDGHDGDGEEDGVGRAPLLVPPVDRAVVVDLGLGLQHVSHEVLQIYLRPVLVHMWKGERLQLKVQRSAKRFVRGCEKFVSALAYLFCLALPGSCVARFA